jgi:hypothetical protein
MLHSGGGSTLRLLHSTFKVCSQSRTRSTVILHVGIELVFRNTLINFEHFKSMLCKASHERNILTVDLQRVGRILIILFGRGGRLDWLIIEVSLMHDLELLSKYAALLKGFFMKNSLTQQKLLTVPQQKGQLNSTL